MVAFAKDYAPEIEAPDAENRVWEFFLATPETRRVDRRPARHPRREKPDRFTKTASGMSYYGFRFYSPGQGRFLNRDPVNEPGSQLVRDVKKEGNLDEELNLYAFVQNDPINFFDWLGLEIRWSITENRAGDGLAADIWYVNAEEECCGGEIKFKQRAKTTGLTRWRRGWLATFHSAKTRWHWDPVGSSYPYWYPHQYPQLAGGDGGSQIIYMMEDRPGGMTNIQQEFWTMAFCVYPGGDVYARNYYPLEGITWGYDMREFGDINIWPVNRVPPTYSQ